MSADPQFEALGVVPYEDGQFVARIQPFSEGGFEGVCYQRSLDMWRHNPLQLVRGRARLARDKAEVVEDSARRARRRVRWLTREIGADHLLTLTTREAKNDPVQILRRFERFAELYRKALSGRGFQYVAVPEPHPSNPDHWHVHAAVRGRIHVNVARGIWAGLCGGRGMGNVDAQWIKCRSGLDRSVRVARYISKYVTKTFDAANFPEGRKRYRASRTSLAPRSKVVFGAASCNEAFDVLLGRLGLSVGDVQVFFFREGNGFWFSCNGDVGDSPPPF